MTISYFGIYNPDFSRNRIYIDGLRKIGVKVVECQDNSPGLLKYWRLFKKHRKVRHAYDALIVGYPGHIIVPFAKLISPKMVVADLLGSLEDAEVYSHNPSYWKRLKAKVADYVAVTFADVVLLESKAQKDFFIKKFGKKEKYHVIYTGAREEFAKKEKRVNKETTAFKVLFRGRLTPESGINHILKAAEILKNNQGISFLIIGGGQLLPFAQKEIQEKKLDNVEHIYRFLSDQELVDMASDVDLSLGQIENNPRLNRTIPHKAFESFALGVPYLTGNAPAVSELVKEGETGFLTVLANPQKLAEKITYLSGQKELLEQVAVKAKEMFDEQLSPSVLAKEIMAIISQTKNLQK